MPEDNRPQWLKKREEEHRITPERRTLNKTGYVLLPLLLLLAAIQFFSR
jgi:hypothetical protein